MAFRQEPILRACAAAFALFVGAACTLTPEPRTRELREPSAASSPDAAPAAPAPAAGPSAETAPAERTATDEMDVGDTTGADAVEALTWIAALFATGIDTYSETNPLTAWNHADRSAAGAMGPPPTGPAATEIVDGILRRYREGDPSRADPRGRDEKPSTPPPSDPPKNEVDSTEKEKEKEKDGDQRTDEPDR